MKTANLVFENLGYTLQSLHANEHSKHPGAHTHVIQRGNLTEVSVNLFIRMTLGMKTKIVTLDQY